MATMTGERSSKRQKSKPNYSDYEINTINRVRDEYSMTQDEAEAAFVNFMKYKQDEIDNPQILQQMRESTRESLINDAKANGNFHPSQTPTMAQAVGHALSRDIIKPQFNPLNGYLLQLMDNAKVDEEKRSLTIEGKVYYFALVSVSKDIPNVQRTEIIRL